MLETVKIKHDKAKNGYAIINKSDFDEKKHELFDKPAKKRAPRKKKAE
jgi:hypothetical protein